MLLRHYLQLALTDGVGPITIGRLIETFGTAQGACAAPLADLRSIEGIGSTKSQKIHSSLRAAEAAGDRELAKAHDAGEQIIFPADQVYPLLLRSIPDAP